MTDPHQPSGWSDPTYQPPMPPEPPPQESWSAAPEPSYDPPVEAPISQPTMEGYAYRSPPSQDPYAFPVQQEYPLQPAYPMQPAYPVQPAYAAGPYGQPQYVVARPTNGLAIAALVCSLLGIATLVTFPVGAIMGHIARKQIQQTGEQGDGMALAGVIVGWIGTGFLVLCCGGYLLFVVGMFGLAGAGAAGTAGGY